MFHVSTDEEMKNLGKRIAATLRGGEVIELIGDVGAGKTTFTKGLGDGLGIDEDIQSPSFTISRVYASSSGLELHHYDFYRLQEAGVLSYELAESIDEKNVITVVEWAGTVHDVLPEDRAIVRISYAEDENAREVSIRTSDTMRYLLEAV